MLKNTVIRYGIVAILFHWVMAVLVIGMLCLGLYMADLPKNLTKLKLYGWHKEFGILVLMLVTLRVGWRTASMSPSLNIHRWEKIAALTVHYALYVFMIAMPITGWLISSFAGLPVSFFGLFVLPDLAGANHDLQHIFGEIHQWLAYGLIATICLHVGAAFKHYFIDKDDIMQRMLP